MGRKEAWNKYKDSMNVDLLNEILDVACSINQKVCKRYVPGSFANSSGKSLHMRLQGKGKYSEEDFELFEKRVIQIKEMDVGKIFTINDIREKGTTGHYEREACNYLVCMGVLKRKIIFSDDDEEKKKPIIVYVRCNESVCNECNQDCNRNSDFCITKTYFERTQWVKDYDYDGFDKQ